MLVLLQAGGLQQGGINFDAKVRRNSTDLEDMFMAHISGMDVFARGLIAAAEILENSPYLALKKARYESFDAGPGADFSAGKLGLEDLVSYASKTGEPKQRSGQQEMYERIIDLYC